MNVIEGLDSPLILIQLSMGMVWDGSDPGMSSSSFNSMVTGQMHRIAVYVNKVFRSISGMSEFSVYKGSGLGAMFSRGTRG